MAKWTPDAKDNKTVCGYMVCLLSIVLNVGALACIQALRGEVPSFELYSIRFIVQIFFSVPQQIMTSCDISVKQSKAWLCILCVLCLLTNITYITSPELVALGTFKALASSAELVVLSLIALCWFGERRWHIFASAMTCIVGSLLILQPFNSETQQNNATLIKCNSTITTMVNEGVANASPNIKSIPNDLSSNISNYQSHKTATLANYSHTPTLANGTTSYTSMDSSQMLGNATLIICVNNDTLPTVLMANSSQSAVISSHILGCMLSLGCGVTYSLYFVTINHKLADIQATVLSFWTSMSGLLVSTVVSLSMETITWPNTWQGNALLVGFAVPFGKFKFWKWWLWCRDIFSLQVLKYTKL